MFSHIMIGGNDIAAAKSFYDAAERLGELIDAFAMGKATAAGEGKEYQDLLRWLPEIAADTDLPESEWSEVDQFSIEAAEEYAALKSDSQDWAPLQAKVSRILELARLTLPEEDCTTNTQEHEENHLAASTAKEPRDRS